MPRLLVMILFAANLLYFGWSHFVSKQQPRLTAATASLPQARPVAPAGPPPCATLGPFLDAPAADAAEKQLKDHGWGVVRRIAQELVHDGWWVSVANADAAAQARTLDIIQRWGMRDASAMPDDPQFRVSVGIFSQEQRAEDRALMVQKLKLDAVVTERRIPKDAVWFEVPGVARETLSDGRLRKADLPLEKLRIETCPAAAPAAAPAEAAPRDAGATNDPEEKTRTVVAWSGTV
ncbi:MAG: hypothetical protein ABW278_04710 [Steroidobacteraceae bacterium]